MNAPAIIDLAQLETQKKSQGVAFTLCWAMGIWGAHRFYLKRPHAKTMLIISIVSAPLCIFFFGFAGIAVTVVWAIVDLFSVCGWVREHNLALIRSLETPVAVPG